MEELYSVLTRTSIDGHFAALTSCSRVWFPELAMISQDIPLGSAWRYLLREWSVANIEYDQTGDTVTIRHVGAWLILQNILLAEPQNEFNTSWSQDAAFPEQGKHAPSTSLDALYSSI